MSSWVEAECIISLETLIIALVAAGAGAPLTAGNILDVVEKASRTCPCYQPHNVEPLLTLRIQIKKGEELVSTWDRISSVLEDLAEVVSNLAPQLYGSFESGKALEKAKPDIEAGYQSLVADAKNLTGRCRFIVPRSSDTFVLIRVARRCFTHACHGTIRLRRTYG